MSPEAKSILRTIERDGALVADMKHIRVATLRLLDLGQPHLARIACYRAVVSWVCEERGWLIGLALPEGADPQQPWTFSELLAEVAWALAERVYAACVDAQRATER